MTAEDFRGFFPGSKQELPRVVEPIKVASPDDSAWDGKPIIKRVGGEPVEFFTIGAVCKIFGRPAVTIRLWITEEKIPEARYRTEKIGKSRGGRRLYTRAQLETLILIAQQRRLLTSPRIDWEKNRTFADDVRAAWDSLSA